MRTVGRRVVVALAAVVALASPAFAQAPGPTVTINGLVDFVSTAYRNWSQFSGAPGAPDPTTGGKPGWYSRERGVFTLTGAVGRVTGVCNEWVAAVTYRFAPNMVSDFAAAYLVTGGALDIHSAQARDVYKITGRFRLTF